MKQLARQQHAQAQMLTQYKDKICFGWQTHPPADVGTSRQILDNFAESNQTLGENLGHGICQGPKQTENKQGSRPQSTQK